MKETRSTGQAVKESDVELTNETTFYTVKGKQDAFDEKGYPTQKEENQFTYAKITGVRRMLRLDDRGHLINPNGLYNDKVKLDRWVPATKEAFASYLEYLKTKNQMFIRQAERNLV